MIELNNPFKSRYGTAVYAFSILGLLLGMVVCMLILQSVGGVEKASPALKMAVNIVLQLFNLAVMGIYLVKYKSKPTIFVKVKISPVFYVAGVLLGALCVFFFAAITSNAASLLELIGVKLSVYETGITLQDIFLLVIVVGFAPIAEELIFRSALLSGLDKKIKGRGRDISVSLLCALAFSFMHMNPEQTVYTFCLGFALSMLTLSCRSVIPAMLGHLTSNLIGALYNMEVAGITDAFVLYEKVFFGSLAANIISTHLLTAAGVAVIIFGTRALKRFAPAVSAADTAEVEVAESDETQSLSPSRRRGKKLFTLKNSTMVYYFLTLILTIFLWVSSLISSMNAPVA